MSVSTNMKALFEPESFAVIGASHSDKKIGNIFVRNIVSGGYEGKLYPINPSGGELYGKKVYESLKSVPGSIDGAAIVLPASGVIEAVKQCAAKGIGFVQIIASGFSEVGNTQDEAEIARIARENNMRILGPNVFGLFSSTAKMNATFSSTDITPGNVAILTQSGALGVALVGKAVVEKHGLSAIVSTGNKCDIDESDLLEHLIEDDNTRAILIYLEGVKNGERFIKALRKATEIKPVVVLKSGRSVRGALAAAAHSASWPGSDEIFDAVMKQCGAIRADTLEEAMTWSQFLAGNESTDNMKTVIITNGGGVGIMAADTAERYRVNLVDDLKDLQTTFKDSVPSYGSMKNPIDLTASARSKDYLTACDSFIKNSEMNAAVFLFCDTAHFDVENIHSMVTTIYDKCREARKPVTFALLGGENIETLLKGFKGDGLPVHYFVEDAVTSLGALTSYGKWKGRVKEEYDVIAAENDTIKEGVKKTLAKGRNFMVATEYSEMLQSVGIPVLESRVAKDINSVVAAADELGYPLVMKVVSPDTQKKTEMGGIAMGLDDRNEVIDAFEAIKLNVKTANSDAVIDGVQLTPDVFRGVEINIEAHKERSMGIIMSCSLGGIFADINPRVAYRSYPITRSEARGMLEEIGAYPLLLGIRWDMRKDIEALVDVMLKTGVMVAGCQMLSSIELDPLAVYDNGKGVSVLDARILLTNTREESR